MTIAEAKVIDDNQSSGLDPTLAPTASIDLGVCGVFKVSLTDSPLNLYYVERTYGVAACLADWIDSDWSEPASSFRIPEGF